MGCFGGAAERKEGTSEHLKCAAVIGLQVQDHLEGLDGCRRLAQLETSCTKEKPGGRQFGIEPDRHFQWLYGFPVVSRHVKRHAQVQQ